MYAAAFTLSVDCIFFGRVERNVKVEELDSAIEYFAEVKKDLGPTAVFQSKPRPRAWGGLAQQMTLVNTAIAAMQAEKERMENHALTAENLMEMVGQPVWVDTFWDSIAVRVSGWHLVVGDINADGKPTVKLCMLHQKFRQTFFVSEVDQTFRAYRYEKKEVQ